MAVNWNLAIETNVLIASNNLVAAIYDASTPTVLFQKIVLPKPYGGTVNITFINCDYVVYNFVLYESPDTTATGQIRNQFSLQPSQQVTKVRPDLYLTADESVGFPTTDRLGYSAADLSGWQYSLESVGIGTLKPVVDYFTTDTSWRLTDPINFIQSGQRFCMRFVPIVSDIPYGSSAGAVASGIQIITADTTVGASHIGKALLLQSATTTLTITLDLTANIPDNKSLMFLSSGGFHKNAIIKCSGSEMITWGGSLAKIVLGQQEQLWLFKSGSTFYVLPGTSDTIKMVGDVVFSYTKQEVNTIFAMGQLLSRTVYSRLFAYMQTIESVAIIAEGNWADTDTAGNAINKGKWTYGDGSTTFRVPLLYNTGYLGIVDGMTRGVGTFSEQGNAPHVHPGSDTDTTVLFVKRKQGGPGAGFGLNSATSGFELVEQNTGKNTGTVTKPKDTGIYALIRT